MVSVREEAFSELGVNIEIDFMPLVLQLCMCVGVCVCFKRKRQIFSNLDPGQYMMELMVIQEILNTSE